MKAPTLLTTAVAAGMLAAGCVTFADDCRYTEPRHAAVALEGATSVRIEAEAGSLEVRGVPGLTEVRADGTACSSRESGLQDIELEASRRGSEVLVRVRIDDGYRWSESRRLDLTVEVPASADLWVTDGSGSTTITGVASVDIEDGSGSILIEDVAGAVTVEDGSGEIRVARIGGDLEVRDGSGEIEAEGVAGNVRVEDGSGEIDLRDVGLNVLITEDGSGGIRVVQVQGSVTVRDDGSGSIDATDVVGDFTVESDGSGGIHHERIGGRVSIPADD